MRLKIKLALLLLPLDEDIQNLVNEYEEIGATISLFQYPEYLELSSIKVNERKRGTGTAFMEKLVDLADLKGLYIFLTPSMDFGATSVSRLESFYSRFGFKKNTGRNKDFRTRHTMIRTPKDSI